MQRAVSVHAFSAVCAYRTIHEDLPEHESRTIHVPATGNVAPSIHAINAVHDTSSIHVVHWGCD